MPGCEPHSIGAHSRRRLPWPPALALAADSVHVRHKIVALSAPLGTRDNSALKHVHLRSGPRELVLSGTGNRPAGPGACEDCASLAVGVGAKESRLARQELTREVALHPFMGDVK